METDTNEPSKVKLDPSDVKKVANQVIQQQQFEEEEFEEELETGEVDFDEESEDTDKRLNFDVFQDVIKPLMDKGVLVTWTLRKDNAVIVSGASYPYSWAQVHKKYGAGSYQLRSRNDTTGKWIKSQRMNLGEYLDENKSDDNSSTSITSILEQTRKMQEANREERRIERQELMDAQKEREAKLMEQMKGGGDTMQLFQLMMQQQREDQRRSDDLRREDERQRREDQQRLDDLRREEKKEERERQEKLEAKREAERKEDQKAFQETLLALGSNKEETVSLREYFKDIEDAKEKAKKEAKAEMKEIERKAEEIAESKKGEDKSITDKAVESVLSSLPAFAKVLGGEKSAPAVTTNPRLTHNPQRRVKRPVKKRPVQTAQSASSVPQGFEIEGMESNTKENSEVADREKVAILAKRVEEIVSPIILASLVSDKGYKVCFAESSQELTNSGIDIRLVSKIFSKERLVELFAENGLIEIAKSQNKETQLNEWIDGYYEEFTKTE